ncbi:MAG: penicillin-binding protein 1A [Candidatus Sericytochromatia bacterium]|nr:penicillin-binding protein 1A [Candidatus Sericytochromatia bacterium]
MSTFRRGSPAAPPRTTSPQTVRRASVPPPRPPGPSRTRQVVSRLGIYLASVSAAAALGAFGGLAVTLSRLPDVSTLQFYVPHETTKIFDKDGHLIANVHGEENRVVLPLHDIPKSLQHAVIAMEDTDFYDHYGINPKGIGRALLVNVAEGQTVEGASTLTQQLAKNLFLEPAKTLPRKIAEAWLAIQIEHHYGKSQILEMYLNQVYWGHNAYGVEAAALNYFGKSSRKLTLAESAMLAGILRGPEYFSPYRNPKGARKLQRLVLDRMLFAGFINDRQHRDALKQELKYPGITSYAYKVPYFTAWMIQQLVERYGPDTVMKGGLRVYTTLDLDLQVQAERMLREAVAKNAVYNIHQGALVAVEPKSGYVRAIVGGTDFKKTKFNRATQALRPPGSTFKPFVYLAALSAGYTPGTVIEDEPISIPIGNGQVYSPNNYDYKFRGPITMRRALESSVNIVAVKLGHQVGLDRVIKTAQTLGVTSKLGENLSLPLGTSEVTPFEMASAYAVLANDGHRNPATMVVKIEDRNGRLLEDNRPRPQRVYEAEPVRQLVSMMRGVILHGTGTAANLGRPAGGKTGTTSDARDVWFVGFTPDLACSVWMGNDDNSKLNYGSTGGTVCAPLWREFMTYAHRDIKPHDFPAPSKVKEARANKRTGKLLKDGEAPAPEDGVPSEVEIDPMTGLPARPTTTSEPVMTIQPVVPEQPPPVRVPVNLNRPTVAKPLPPRPKLKPVEPEEPPPTEPQTDETLLEPVPEMPAENP